MDPLRRPLPLISKRIEFEDAESDDALPPLPTVTHRIEFNELLPNEIDNGLDKSHSLSLSDRSESLSSEKSSNLDDDDAAAGQDHDQNMDVDDVDDIDNDDLPSNVPIAKPQGEPGRPHSGGYNLAKALVGWTRPLYTNVNDFVKAEARMHLNTRLSYNKQDQGKIADICATTAKRYPIISKYDNYWPVRDMLKLHLKYKAEKYNRRTQS